MSATFTRSDKWLSFSEQLQVVFDDGHRVIVKNEEGNVALDCSRWLFDQCWKRGWFHD